MGCLRLDILEQSFVPMQIVYKNGLGIDPLADQGGQQTLSPYHAMACNPVLMVDPLGLQAQPLMHNAYGNNHTVSPPGYFIDGHYVYLSTDRLNKAKNNFASYSLRAESISNLLKIEILKTILDGLGEGASFNRTKYGEGTYKFWYNGFGYHSGELDEGQTEGSPIYKWKAGVTVLMQSLIINFNESNISDYGSGLSYQGDRGNGVFNTIKDIFDHSTFIPGTALSFVEETKYGRWASMGGLKFSTAPYSIQKSLINEAKWTGKYIKGAGKGLGYTGLIFTGADMVVNGINTSNSLDATMGIVSLIPGGGWIAGGIYFIGNATLKATTGMNAGQWIDVGINKMRGK